jgi:hypothetical protein
MITGSMVHGYSSREPQFQNHRLKVNGNKYRMNKNNENHVVSQEEFPFSVYNRESFH